MDWLVCTCIGLDLLAEAVSKLRATCIYQTVIRCLNWWVNNLGRHSLCLLWESNVCSWLEQISQKFVHVSQSRQVNCVLVDVNCVPLCYKTHQFRPWTWIFIKIWNIRSTHLFYFILLQLSPNQATIPRLILGLQHAASEYNVDLLYVVQALHFGSHLVDCRNN